MNTALCCAMLAQAPLVGTLMEVLQAVRLPDGRLLVLAVAIGRFKVRRGRQCAPGCAVLAGGVGWPSCMQLCETAAMLGMAPRQDARLQRQFPKPLVVLRPSRFCPTPPPPFLRWCEHCRRSPTLAPM